MTRLIRFFTTMTVLSAGLITGCASVKMASPNEDAKAKTFATTPSLANLYVYRNESMGAAIRMAVELDGKEIGKTAANTYLIASVSPGKHSLVSKAENDSSLDINAEAGQNYYVWQEVKMGLLSARSKLQLVDAAQGQAGVRETKLIDTTSDAPKTTSTSTSTNPVAPSASASNKNEPVASQSAVTSVVTTTTSAAAMPIPRTDSLGKIEKIPFELGVSSNTIERMAKQNSCQSQKGAGIIFKKGPIEVYRVSCEDGRELMARCELRQCNFFTP